MRREHAFKGMVHDLMQAAGAMTWLPANLIGPIA
jgi:hypothetical protein